MGSGSSRNKVQTFDKSSQMPPVSHSKPPPSPSKSNEPVFKRVPTKPIRPQSSVRDDKFELEPNIEEYSSIWDSNTKLSSIFQQSLKSNSNHIEHHQKETLNNKSTRKSSTNIDSAHVESIVDTQIHSCINLSSSEKIDEFIKNLNHIHTQLDNTIKRRTEQISIETESIHKHILNETQRKQQRLLNYAKQQQLKQDEIYQKSLEEFLSTLDEMKAKDLAELQKQLKIYREQILEESQLKIMTVNEQTNLIKAKILKEEQQQATEKIDSIIAQIQKISTDDKSHHLGSELITTMNILTNSNVGTKASGQNCDFKFEQNDSSRPRSLKTRERKLIREEESNQRHKK